MMFSQNHFWQEARLIHQNVPTGPDLPPQVEKADQAQAEQKNDFKAKVETWDGVRELREEMIKKADEDSKRYTEVVTDTQNKKEALRKKIS